MKYVLLQIFDEKLKPPWSKFLQKYLPQSQRLKIFFFVPKGNNKKTIFNPSHHWKNNSFFFLSCLIFGNLKKLLNKNEIKMTALFMFNESIYNRYRFYIIIIILFLYIQYYNININTWPRGHIMMSKRNI